MADSSGTAFQVGAATVAIGALKLGLAGSLGVLGDEAYHWVWAQRPAFGYFDQPPLIAWVIAAADATVGHTALALRLGPLVLAVVGVGLLASRCRDQAFGILWLFGLPPLFWMTQFAVPDTLLLGGWAVALWGAHRGGPGLLVAGIGAGLAGLAKPTAWVLGPLIVLALPAAERHSRWLVAGALANLGLIAPFVWWSATHDGLPWTFQASENLRHGPEWGGLVAQLTTQAAFSTPLAFAATWALAGRSGRTARLAWMTSLPVLGAFAVAGMLGPPEAHWPAPAYLGAGLGLAATTGWRHRLAWVGALTGTAASALITIHAFVPLVQLPLDPAAELAAGRVVAERVARWALDEGVSSGDGGAHVPVYTERYQEAAWVHYHTGIAATVLPGCGRRTQYDLWRDGEDLEPGYFVRPARSGRPQCVDRRFGTVVEVQAFEDRDAAGRRLGPWDLWQVTP